MCAALALFAGCKIGETTADKFLKDKEARDQQVTYYANGGKFDGLDLNEKNVYYKVGSEIIVDFDKIKNFSIERTDYIFDGWYKVELDDEGKPVFEDKENKIAKLTDEWIDPAKPVYIKEKEHFYFGAKWLIDVRIEFILVTDGGKPITVADGTKIECGEPVAYQQFGKQPSVKVDNSKAPDCISTDYTFYDYYSDEACTKPFSGSVNKPDSGSDNVKLYAKYIEGQYTMVRSPSDAVNMMNGLAEEKSYYIFKDIDCSGNLSFGLQFGTNTNATIVGNGHTISNLAITLEFRNGDSASLLGKLTSKAKISDLTFSNITLNATVRPNAIINSMHLFVTEVQDGAKLENVSFNKVNWKVTLPDTSTVINIQKKNGVYDSSCWLFGGFTTDAAFFENYNTVKVTDATLSMGPKNSETAPGNVIEKKN